MGLFSEISTNDHFFCINNKQTCLEGATFDESKIVSHFCKTKISYWLLADLLVVSILVDGRGKAFGILFAQRGGYG